MAYRDPAVGRARDLERYHRRTAARKAAGLCPRCGKRPPEPGRSLCEPCSEKHRISSRVSDAKRRARGRKRRRDPEKARACERRRYRRKTAERIAAGLCPSCGKAPPQPQRRLCSECAEKKRAGDRRRYAKAKASGALYGGKSAEFRRRNGRDRSKQRYHERREAGLCVRCGESARPQTAARRARNAVLLAIGTSVPDGMPGARRVCADRAATPRRMERPAARAAPRCRRAGRRAEPTPGRCTPGGAPETCARIAAGLRWAPRGACLVRAAPLFARGSIAVCRPGPRASP